MDIFWIFTPIFLLYIVGNIIKSNWFKGYAGELLVNLTLRLFLNKDNYYLLKDVYLPTDNDTTQIDHIIVSRYGVFVIETKNMKGWIFGSANNKQWTQHIYKRKYRFQNPQHQNYKHIQALLSCVKITKHAVFSVIVFVGDVTFKTAMPENVIYKHELIRYIKSHTTTVLTTQEMTDIIQQIHAVRLQPSFKVRIAHAATVEKIKHRKSIGDR